uniref:Uncharacterized protein n=1 Tax=Anguilla anguilla TaxID=7936 RepID=A0A0E9SAK8_ANGAN
MLFFFYIFNLYPKYS